MQVNIRGIKVKKGSPFFLIAGPCVIESKSLCLEIAGQVKEICLRNEIFYVFKSSFDKANRSSVQSFRGPGFEKGLDILNEVKEKTGLPVLSDIHEPRQAEKAAGVLDIIQIPAFLCRQTDIIVEAGKTGKPVNVKKGQFMAPGDISNIIEKLNSTGNSNVMITDRGTSFGYHNLVVDFRGFEIMKKEKALIGFDATHSVQLPGGQGKSSGGEKEFISPLAMAASAVGIDFLYTEVHINPGKARCDAPNTLGIAELEQIVKRAKRIEREARAK